MKRLFLRHSWRLLIILAFTAFIVYTGIEGYREYGMTFKTVMRCGVLIFTLFAVAWNLYTHHLRPRPLGQYLEYVRGQWKTILHSALAFIVASVAVIVLLVKKKGIDTNEAIGIFCLLAMILTLYAILSGYVKFCASEDNPEPSPSTTSTPKTYNAPTYGRKER